MATTDFIAAIELSSSKLSGIAGRKNSDGSLQVLAYAQEDASPFVHKGIIYNVEKAATALTFVIKELENQLHYSIDKVYAGISGLTLRTVPQSITRELSEESVISQELVDSIYEENRSSAPGSELNVLDVAPQEYSIDNILQADPVGVTGRHVIGRFLNIVARNSLKKNLELSFEYAEMTTADDFIVSPLALAQVVLTPGEMRAGCALVDFGADTTTVAVYKDNLLRFLSVLPLGGSNITQDIASLKMEKEQAEKLKLQYGDALYLTEEGTEAQNCTTEDGRTISLALLNDIVGARAEEIIANVCHQLKLSGYEGELLAGIVLTGGGSNLKNLEELFRKMSKTEKVKTAKFTHLIVQDGRNLLAKDGRQNTLLGLLQWGRENCCKPEPVKEKPVQPEQTHLFEEDEDLKRLEAENRKRLLEEEKKRKKEEEQRRREEEEQRRREEKKNNPGLLGRLKNIAMTKAEEIKGSLFDDDETMN